MGLQCWEDGHICNVSRVVARKDRGSDLDSSNHPRRHGGYGQGRLPLHHSDTGLWLKPWSPSPIQKELTIGLLGFCNRRILLRRVASSSHLLLAKYPVARVPRNRCSVLPLRRPKRVQIEGMVPRWVGARPLESVNTSCSGFQRLRGRYHMTSL